MFFGMSEFDKNLENATSHLKLDPDWETIMLIADGIRQNDVAPKTAITAIRKKMNSANPHSASYALLVLESIVKNCGAPVHDEICTKESCEWFTQFIESTPHDNVKAKMLELIQVWAFAFRAYDKYQAIRDIVTILKQKGHTFPQLKEADAMFTSETAPDWSDGKVCSRCRVLFSFTQRKHHCRNCGRIFCAQCSAKTCTLPKFGIEKEVRVCEGCFTALHSAGGGGGVAAIGGGGGGGLKRDGSGSSGESDLPAEYLASTLAQQSQQPPRKSEQELKEEEELQLALALSQSEAEAQKPRGLLSGGGSYRGLAAAAAAAAAAASGGGGQRTKSPTPDAPSSLQLGGGAGSIYGGASAAGAAGSGSEAPFEQSIAGDPELAKYMNRDYWEQRKQLESPASPSAPSPMSQTSSVIPLKSGAEDVELSEFSHNMRTQVEIFVNRMKSNSSRGRNIVTDSAVQTLFMTLTTYHSRLLTYIKDMDDKRMWHEQLQDKLAQVKDSRAALDVLRQEHVDKVRAQAEEQERQRQLLMAHKLDIMRKKKQEYLQYQRQMALQRIQEQEREMAMRQEQQKAMYQMGGGGGMLGAAGAFGATGMMAQGSPHHAGGGLYGGPQQPMGMAMGMGMGMVGLHGQMVGMGQQPQQQQPQQHGLYGPAVMGQPQQPQQLPPMQQQQQQQQQGGVPNVAMQMQMPPGAGQFMGVPNAQMMAQQMPGPHVMMQAHPAAPPPPLQQQQQQPHPQQPHQQPLNQPPPPQQHQPLQPIVTEPSSAQSVAAVAPIPAAAAAPAAAPAALAAAVPAADNAAAAAQPAEAQLISFD